MNPVIYEVNISYPPNIRKELLHWLKIHIHDMEALEYFNSGSLVYEVQGESSQFSVHYYTQSHSLLDNYFNEMAEKMRADLPDKLKSKCQFSRRVLNRLSVNTLPME